MKILNLRLSDFMLFDQIELEWSKNINVICGSNSTGKTVLIKLMYSLMISYLQIEGKAGTKEKSETAFVDKLTHVFRPEDMQLGRLARRKQGGSKAKAEMEIEEEGTISLEFSERAKNRMELHLPEAETKTAKAKPIAVYLPPKEIISSTENFRSLYEDMHIAFEETYYDLARLLDRPLKKGKNTEEQNRVLSALGKIIKGTICQRNNKFYLKVDGQGEFEMGLVSEGYRKLGTLAYLIRNGALGPGSILFWDEPETNMNPKMIRPLVEAIVELAKMGVQVFVTTHDYFIQQYFNLYTVYPEINAERMDIRFISLYEEGNRLIRHEEKNDVGFLEHNAIMEEFDAIYDRELGLIHDEIRERN